MSRVLLLVLSFVACLASAEIAVRIFDLGPTIRPVFRENFRLSENSVLGYEHVPHSPDGKDRFNSYGMRGRDTPLRKPEGTFRIAVVGDSIAFGFDVARSRGFGRVLERTLNRDFARSGVSFEVLNFCVAGYGVPQVVEAVRDGRFHVYGVSTIDEGDRGSVGRSRRQCSRRRDVRRGHGPLPGGGAAEGPGREGSESR